MKRSMTRMKARLPADDMVLTMRVMLLRLFYYLLRMRRPHTPPGPPVFLVLQYRIPLGCCVHGTPIYAALKAAQPGCVIIVATCGLGHATLMHDPNIDYLLDTPDPGTSFRNLSSHAHHLRDQLQRLSLRPTYILQDASNCRGTLAIFALLLRLAPTRSFANIPQLCDELIAYDPSRSLIANNLRLVSESSPPTEPAVYFTLEDLSNARSLLQAVNVEGHPLTAIVVQGSGAQPNNWHDDRFTALIQHVESLGHRTVFLGTLDEAPAIERIRCLASSSGPSLAGRTSIPELAALLCLCDTLITVDTGTLHVGRAAQIPMLVLAPTWQPAIEWLPIDVGNAIVLRGEDRTAIPADYQLDEISTKSAMDAFTQLADRYPPSVSVREQRVARLLSNTRA